MSENCKYPDPIARVQQGKAIMSFPSAHFFLGFNFFILGKKSKKTETQGRFPSKMTSAKRKRWTMPIIVTWTISLINGALIHESFPGKR
jgi:hypothetical protein